MSGQAAFLGKSGPRNTKGLDRPARRELLALATGRGRGEFFPLQALWRVSSGLVLDAGSVGTGPAVLTLSLSPQATYVLLALAWVFVPIYISSEVSLVLGTQGGLTWVGVLLPLLGSADEQEPRLDVVERAHCVLLSPTHIPVNP